jgi:hemerythrin
MESNILTNVQIINMIYKESYKNKFVTGFGDFLRGSYFILDFCRKFKIKYNILIYHPIHHFFKHPTINREIPNTIIDSIEYCEYCNINFDANSTFNSDISTLYKEFFNYLNRQDIYNRNLFIYTVCYPTLQIHSENKQIIRKIIEPIDEIENNINQILGQLKLFKKNYIIIQIRSGDDFLNKSNNKLSNEYKEKIISILKNLILGKKKAFLLIADNLLVKNLIIRQFPFIKTFFKDITHLGENAKLNRENIKNTLIDFYIMSYASFIYSISTYEHGSGFSKWCAVTYEIPYHCIKI